MTCNPNVATSRSSACALFEINASERGGKKGDVLLRSAALSVLLRVVVLGPQERPASVPVHAGVAVVDRRVDLVLMLILGQNVLADRRQRLEIAAAVEIGRVVGVPRSVVDGRCRIRTERTRAGGHGATPGQDRVRCRIVLDPVHQRTEQILRLWSNPAATMSDARSPEQP